MSEEPRDAAEMWDRLQALPSMRDEPLAWDHHAGGFVHHGEDRPAPPAPPPPPPAADPSAAPPAPEPPSPPRAAAAGPAGPGGPEGPASPSASPSAGPRRMSSATVGAQRGHVVVNPGDAAPRSSAGAGPPAPSAAASAPPRPPAGGVTVAPPPARPVAPPRNRPPAPPKAPKTRRPRRRGRIIRRTVIAVLLVPVLLLAGLFAYGYYKFSQIPRVTVASVLSPATGAGTNYLIVGTDSREGITAEDPNAGAFLGGGGEGEPTGSRTDTIMVLRVAGDQQQLLSIPRDLWVTDPSTQQKTRINATFGAGPANLIKAVTALGIPVHHYLEINFVAFGKLVDAVGGIDIDFPFPARDTNSGLNITEPGPHHLDGTQALAYVRARHYEEFKDGKWVTDPLSDLGRVQRQRAFLTALMSEVADTRNPLSLARIGDSTSVGLKLDETLSLVDVLRLGLELRSFKPESLTVPVTPRTTTGGAAILELNTAEAAPLLAQFAA